MYCDDVQLAQAWQVGLETLVHWPVRKEPPAHWLVQAVHARSDVAVQAWVSYVPVAQVRQVWQVGLDDTLHVPVRNVPPTQFWDVVHGWHVGVVVDVQLPSRYDPELQVSTQLAHTRFVATEHDVVSYCDDPHVAHATQMGVAVCVQVPFRYDPEAHVLVQGWHVGVVVLVH